MATYQRRSLLTGQRRPAHKLVRSRYYLAGQVAKILGVSTFFVKTLFKSGELPYVRLRSSKRSAYRVEHKVLLKYLREHGLQHPERELLRSCKPLIVFSKLEEVAAICETFDDLVQVTCWVDLGIAIAEAEPRGVIIDLACGKEECVQCAMRLHNDYHRPTIVLVTYADSKDLQKSGLWDITVPYPDQMGSLAQVMKNCERS